MVRRVRFMRVLYGPPVPRGFRVQWREPLRPDFEVYSIRIPHWFLALIFAIAPSIWLFKWNKRRKISPNGCAACGYDLTGHEMGICPECGANKIPAV